MKETRFVEECLMDPSSGQRASPQRAIYEALCGEKHSSGKTSPCDFFLFPKVKPLLKGTRFKSVDAVKAKAAELRNTTCL